jgi:hypothetical protein
MRLASALGRNLRKIGFEMKETPRFPRNRAVFILRIWLSQAEEPDWVGEVQDVHSGELVHIQGIAGLQAFLEKRMVALENNIGDKGIR